MGTSDSAILAIVGGGNMGAALAGGLLSSGFVTPGDLMIVEVLEARRQQLAQLFPGVTVSATIGPCGSAVIAVKPQTCQPLPRLALGLEQQGFCRLLLGSQ